MGTIRVWFTLLLGVLLFPKPAFSATSFSETIVRVFDQNNHPIPSASVSASYGCKTFNPVDSAGWTEEASYSGKTDDSGKVTFPQFQSGKVSFFSPCSKGISVYKSGYANLDSNHPFSSYSKLDLCLQETVGGSYKGIFKGPDSETFSACKARASLPTGESTLIVKLYKLKTYKEIEKGISVTDNRQELARDFETLTSYFPSLSISERQPYYPLLKLALSKLPTTFKQPLFEDEAIYTNALKCLGYLCNGSKERVAIFQRWIHWLEAAEQSDDSGWSPILIARTAAQGLAFYNDAEAAAALEEYLLWEEKHFHEKFPQVKEPNYIQHAWKLQSNFNHVKEQICGSDSPVDSRFLEQDWDRHSSANKHLNN